MIAANRAQHPDRSRRRARYGALALLLASTMGVAGSPTTATAQTLLEFPRRPAPPPKPSRADEKQMLVRAARIDYDYNNERVAAVGNVQIYYQGSTLEADRVTYDQRAKRLNATGNVRLTEPDGNVTHGDVLDLTDDFRDGFINSLRVETADQTRFAAARANRTEGNYTVLESGVYTACEPCRDNPQKPPLWQVKAARIVHDQNDKTVYFEDARLEFFGVPLAYLPYFSAPDPTVKRKSGFLFPIFSSSGKYGVAAEIPYFWALAPNYDLTLSPVITSRQSVLGKGEFRHRLLDGAYSIRAAGIFQQDLSPFVRSDGTTTPGYRNFRGSLESTGQFALTNRWTWGWAGTVLTDRTFFQDYGLLNYSMTGDSIFQTRTEAISQLYLIGRGDRSYFDLRTQHFFGFSEADDQRQLPVIHPVLDYNYTFENPVLNGELGLRANFTSMTRGRADFDAITAASLLSGACEISANPAAKLPANCLLRGAPGTYTRLSAEATWRRTITDPFGQMFTPFASVRTDLATAEILNDPGVSNFTTPGQREVGRVMPTVGLEYRYPFIAAQSWGTQTIEPIAQVIMRPNEAKIGAFPNEDAQSLVFDDTNLFRIDKFSGWDRAEGGGRLNVGLQYRAQFNRAGSITAIVGQSYHLFGQNSFAVGDLANTGLDSGLETRRSDYVAGVRYQPNEVFTFGSHFRFDETNLTVRRFEVTATANLGRLSATMIYGNYDAQPALGLTDRRSGVLGSGLLKLTPNWALLGGARYDIERSRFNQTQIGVGYIDDCLILALNYIKDYSNSGNTTADHRLMVQIGLRTLGSSAVSQSVGSTGL